MAKTLKDLNWNLFLVNLIFALLTGLGIVLAGSFTFTSGLAVIAGIIIKDNLAFFADAKKQLSE
ncbi:MAG: hypothetical protein FD167_3475 [bacterium]|nr:MAG: hypothetical protein FD167_3475 [bacterium]